MFDDNNKNQFLYILKSANSFNMTFQLLTILSQQDEDNNPYIIPSVVNATFAIELYLKAILTYKQISYKKGSKGHNIKYLFEIIPKKVKKTITLKYESEKKKSSQLFLYNSLQEYLDHEYNSFEMWRYIFDEWKDKRFLFPNNETKILLNILKKECDEIKGGMIDD